MISYKQFILSVFISIIFTLSLFLSFAFFNKMYKDYLNRKKK